MPAKMKLEVEMPPQVRRKDSLSNASGSLHSNASSTVRSTRSDHSFLGLSRPSGASTKSSTKSTVDTPSSRSVVSHTDMFAAKAEMARKYDKPEGAKQMLCTTTQLIGREKESETLRRVIQEATSCCSSSGDVCGKKRPRVVSITGAAGCGKSFLVQNNTSSKDFDGYLCSGKYTPNGGGGETGLSRCIKDLVKQVVDRDWDMGIRRRLQESISPADAAVLIETYPSLSLLLTEEEENTPAELDKIRRAKRRQFLFLNLLQALTKHTVDQYQDEDIILDEEPQEQNPEPQEEKETIAVPLIMVLDDLQWACRSSMELISALVRDPNLDNFLLIATSRPIEDEPDNPFLQEMDRWTTLDVPIETIQLDNLDQPDVNQLLATLLETDASLTKPLGDVIYQKTKGNPFFTTEFLKTLVEQELVKYNFGQLRWTFDIAHIEIQYCSDSNSSLKAVDLLKEKVRGLPTQHQILLLVAACLGASFGESFLVTIFQRMDPFSIILEGDGGSSIDLASLDRVQLILKVCIDTGVLNQCQEAGMYFFAHDLVKEAALESFGDEEKSKLLKLRVGKCILQQTIQGSAEFSFDDALLFVGVDLCNEASSLLSPNKPAEWIHLARYNMLAGQKAKRESTFALAVNYMEVGIDCLESHAQSERGSTLSLDLYAGAAEAVYYIGDYQKTGRYASKVLSAPDCPKETRFHLTFFQILSAMAQERAEEALLIGRQAIDLLGLAKFPVNPGVPSVLYEFFKTKKLLQKHTQASLLSLPILEDENRVMAMRILDAIQTPAYVANPNFFIITILRTLRWSVKYGICQYTPNLFAIYSFIQLTSFGNSQASVLYSEVALKLAERLDVRETKSRTSMICFSMCRHWTTNLQSCYPSIAYSYRLAMEGGDSETALQALMQMDYASWCSAMVPLQELADDLSHHTTMCRDYKHQAILDILMSMAKHLRSLCAVNDKAWAWLDATSLGKVQLDEADKKPRDLAIQAAFDALSLQSHYLHGEKEEALELAKRTGGIGVKAAHGMNYISQAHFHRGLIFLGEASERRDARRNLRAAKQVMAMMRKWIALGDINCIHMLRLLEAEEARAKGKQERATELYGVAIQAARKIGRVQDTAICHECAAAFYIDVDDKTRAAHHMEQAVISFRDWGAGEKVQQIRRKYSKLLHHGSTILSVMQSCTMGRPSLRTQKLTGPSC